MVHSPSAGSSANNNSSVRTPFSNGIPAHCLIGDPPESSTVTSTEPDTGSKYLRTRTQEVNDLVAIVRNLRPDAYYV